MVNNVLLELRICTLPFLCFLLFLFEQHYKEAKCTRLVLHKDSHLAVDLKKIVIVLDSDNLHPAKSNPSISQSTAHLNIL